MKLSSSERKIADGLMQEIIKRSGELSRQPSHIDRKLNAVTAVEYEKLAKNREYTVVREFENENLFARIAFNGKITNHQKVPREHWTPFELEVVNIMTTDPDGSFLVEPIRCKDVDVSNSFRTEAEAINVYEDLLVRHAHCEFIPTTDDDGQPATRLFERGNRLAPPSKDAPVMTAEANARDYSSW